MPLEARPGSQSERPTSIGQAYLAEARSTLQSSLGEITHCLDQLHDEDLGWSNHPSHNSIQNIILHLCGNVRQWIVSAVGGAPDCRDRPKEFSDRRAIPKAELIKILKQTVAEADAALAACLPERLLETKRVQGFQTTLLAAVFDSVSHFVGHTHQIVYITRLRLGDRYRFQWAPATPEQGAESSSPAVDGSGH
jgi:hypothetical protein